MAITTAPVSRGSNQTTSAAASIDRTSVSMTAGLVYYAMVGVHDQNENTITCSGVSNTGTANTWELVRQQAAFGDELHGSIWRCVASATQSVTVSGAIAGGTSNTGTGAIDIIEFASGEVNTADPEVQANSFTESDFSTSGIGTTLTSTHTDNCVVLMVCNWNFSSATNTGDGALSGNEIVEHTHGAGSSATVSIYYLLDSDDSPSATFSATQILSYALAFEVQAGGSVADVPHYRWRNDDGNETTATWAASENTAHTIAPTDAIRLRTQVNFAGDPGSNARTLQYRKVGDSDACWETVT